MTSLEYVLIGIIIILIAIFIFVVRPRLKHRELINEDIVRQNIQIQNSLDKKRSEFNALENSYTTLVNEVAKTQNEKDKISDELIKQQENARQAAQSYYDATMKLSEERVERGLQDLIDKYKQAENDYQKEYEQLMLDLTSTYEENELRTAQQEALLLSKLTDLKQKTAAAVEANKRAEEMRVKQDFYRLQLSEEDIQEIKKLREVLPSLRQKEPLNKVIYKVYYEKPYTDLVGRVIGSGIHTGIYKITNIANGMCYVGQATDIADRWKQHVRRGVGADAPGRNKLYPAMLSFGVENFTFEVIEECQAVQLNEREQYWQEYFKAKEFGYSIR